MPTPAVFPVARKSQPVRRAQEGPAWGEPRVATMRGGDPGRRDPNVSAFSPHKLRQRAGTRSFRPVRRSCLRTEVGLDDGWVALHLVQRPFRNLAAVIGPAVGAGAVLHQSGAGA
jgi:hypothetical protein